MQANLTTGTAIPARTTLRITVAVGTVTVDDQPLVEPFSDLGPCDENGTTQAMAACSLEQVQKADKQLDALQRKQFDAATTNSAKQALLDQNAAWLTKRGTDCAARPRSGGTIDQINGAACLLTASQAGLRELTGLVG